MPESILEAAARRSQALEADRAHGAGVVGGPGGRAGAAAGQIGGSMDEGRQQGLPFLGALKDVLALATQPAEGSDGLKALVALQHRIAA